SVLLCGTKTTEASARKHVGFLPENPAFYDFLSAREYLRFVAASFNMQASEVEKRIDAVFEQLDLTAAAKRPIRSYSKGMVQRLGLAQVLLHDPDVYILDEPMSGLDPQGRALVKELIRDLKFAGKTVFFSTHITADIEKVCDRMAIIVGGKICANADVEEVMRSGVERYRLISTPKDDSLGERHEFQVAAAELPSKMAELTAAGEVLQLVEPLGRDLENYFLDIVRQHSA
ncbi:MAG: ABC transporter ATP-binding protein, partial [Desulfuromonadales bacterium]|nr:ABC transporter ATP-binding protein [Desulfuromonadales bacterium]